ncbi:MAG: hypothetical protein OEM15_06400 [Myxococcales bacterium]|nr:hypothetical protein [Myxococcales bacterium]MDH3484357.1 hypothetical protein [Myxococcales bacterium]
MTSSGLSETRILVIRFTCLSFALSSFLLGGWMMIDPSSFWGLLGVGGDPFVQALYGGAIWGEGTMFALGAIWPVRYLVFFQYLVIYKTMACLAGLAVLLRMDSSPLGAWLVLGGWAAAGVISAMVFPWPQWRNVESWYGARAAAGRGVG